MHKVMQRRSHDCGVACVAMVAGMSYEVVEAEFIAAGLSIRRGTRQPFSSNFKELTAVIRTLGMRTRIRRFGSWAGVADLSIMKVGLIMQSGSSRDWHWVVARRTPGGVELLDPGTDLPSFETLPDDVLAIDFKTYMPIGSFIEICDRL